MAKEITITVEPRATVLVTEIINNELQTRTGFIFESKDNSNIEVSDGYHTMDELYDHRRALTAALFRCLHELNHIYPHGINQVFKSRAHYDGSMFDGYFIVGIIKNGKTYISYHYAIEYWDEFKIPELAYAPEYDGHTSQDVIERLLEL